MFHRDFRHFAGALSLRDSCAYNSFLSQKEMHFADVTLADLIADIDDIAI